ncbi:MAG: hypothetical protein ACTHJM_01235 [Marmoricola sp.]
MAIDFTTDIGKVRLLVGDIDEADPIFTDAQVEAAVPLFPTLHHAAAHLVDVIASNEALVSKKIKTEDLQTDGPAVATALRAQAVALRNVGQQTLDDADPVAIADFQQAHPWWDIPVFGPYGTTWSGLNSQFGDVWP